MEKMKYDMAGAAAMIGAMHAIARLKPAVKVIGVVCSAENMPDGKAFKPGDIVTAMSGTTVEIINTDAEGRLVLADGLHYAKTLGCTCLLYTSSRRQSWAPVPRRCATWPDWTARFTLPRRSRS